MCTFLWSTHRGRKVDLYAISDQYDHLYQGSVSNMYIGISPDVIPARHT